MVTRSHHRLTNVLAQYNESRILLPRAVDHISVISRYKPAPCMWLTLLESEVTFFASSDSEW